MAAGHVLMGDGTQIEHKNKKGANRLPGSPSKGLEKGEAKLNESTAEMNPFRQIVEEYSPRVFRLAFRMVGNEHDAEEVVQETFLRAYRGLKRFEQKAALGTWLFRIASNCAVDLLRARKKMQQAQNGLEADSFSGRDRDPEQEVSDRQFKKKVTHLLDRLAPKERSAFVLRHFHECSIAEIGEIMGMGQSAVKQAVHRAVLKMRNASNARTL